MHTCLFIHVVHTGTCSEDFSLSYEPLVGDTKNTLHYNPTGHIAAAATAAARVFLTSICIMYTYYQKNTHRYHYSDNFYYYYTSNNNNNLPRGVHLALPMARRTSFLRGFSRSLQLLHPSARTTCSPLSSIAGVVTRGNSTHMIQWRQRELAIHRPWIKCLYPESGKTGRGVC